MTGHWPLSQSINKKSGICSYCKATRQLHLKDGTVHLHGPRKNRCPGSRKAPIDLTSLPVSSTSETVLLNTPTHDQSSHGLRNTPAQHQSSHGLRDTPAHDQSSHGLHRDGEPKIIASNTSLQHPFITSPLIKHIPKSVRSLCCSYLSSLFRKICAAPDDLDSWKVLLNFGQTFLAKPARSGKRHALSSIIRKRFSDDALSSIRPLSSSDISRTVGFRNNELSLTKKISAKLEDGNVTAAIRLLCSEDKPVYDSNDVFIKLLERHPPAAFDRRPFKDPDLTSSLIVTEKEVLKAIRSFPAGSSGGPDGICPKHIIDLISCKTSGQEFLSSVTEFVNMLLTGKCHPAVSPILFGGKLIALLKKSGGVRPITVGYTWRRIAAKCANAYAISSLNDFFIPTQLGVGVSGGCEAAIHATRRFIEQMPSDYNCQA